MADVAIKERDPIAGLTSILDLYNGKTNVSTTSGTTTTTTDKSNLTQEQLDNQINSAMAPLAQASHGAGLSTYSDTNLALGRAQVSADILAKNAGSTRTTVTSGGTTTNNQPGPLSSSRIGSTVGSLALTQIGAPLLKKIGAKTGLTDAVGSAANNAVDSVSSSVANWFAPAVDSSNVVNNISAYIGDSASSASSALADTAINAVGSEAASPVLDAVGSGISEGASSLWDTISSWFSEGGPVKGYASGGYVDRKVDRSYLDSATTQGAVTSANGEIAPPIQAPSPQAPTVGDAVNELLGNIIGGGNRSSNSSTASQASGSSYTNDRYASSLKPGVEDAGLANIGLTGLGALGPLGALAATLISKATDTPNLQSLAVNSLQNQFTRTDSLDAFLNLNNNFSNVPDIATTVSQSSSGNGSTSPSSSATGGDTAAGRVNDRGGYSSSSSDGSSSSSSGSSSTSAADGGHITGPGTSTSDSISAKLSDGEYVIDAKTVAALGPEFFQAIQAKFNPAALESQRAKGRI